MVIIRHLMKLEWKEIEKSSFEGGNSAEGEEDDTDQFYPRSKKMRSWNQFCQWKRDNLGFQLYKHNDSGHQFTVSHYFLKKGTNIKLLTVDINKTAVKTFFLAFWNVLEKLGTPAERIKNIHEKGMMSVPKIRAKKLVFTWTLQVLKRKYCMSA